MNIALIASAALSNKKEATWLTLLSLAKEYTKYGHKVIISAEKNDQLPKIEEIDGIKIYRLYQGKITAGARSMRAISKQENIYFEIIHGFSSSPLLALNTFLAKKIFPKSKTVHTIKSYSLFNFTRKLFPHLLKRMDAVTVPTQKLKEHILKTKSDGFEKKIKIIFSPINTLKFRPRDREALKEKHGYKGKKIILYYGAMREEKGVDCLIQAVPLVLEKRHKNDVEFIFAVRSNAVEKKEKYLAMARSLGCEKYINITLEDLPIEEYVSMADMVVLAYPTLNGTEGNPSCLLESMASKTPVVTTDLPELQEIVEHQKDLLMAKAGDAQSVAVEIKRLLHNPALAKKLTENAYLKSRTFDIQLISRQFINLYEELLNTN